MLGFPSCLSVLIFVFPESYLSVLCWLCCLRILPFCWEIAFQLLPLIYSWLGQALSKGIEGGEGAPRSKFLVQFAHQCNLTSVFTTENPLSLYLGSCFSLREAHPPQKSFFDQLFLSISASSGQSPRNNSHPSPSGGPGRAGPGRCCVSGWC